MYLVDVAADGVVVVVEVMMKNLIKPFENFSVKSYFIPWSF